ncbi:MAG: nucleotidyl transferase AbiEii/AbiGii toxin family protein [Deltaproteobacteria bacterium]|nr:nucleotidyl transferase AbiEii/AbiGii toxin family protein [Deltaproteobacteria bacterium]
MPSFRRPFHRTLAPVLHAFDPVFLLEARCFFAGGTLLALMLDEYRESRDIDFLCASRDGFRRLRETVSERSLGKLLRTEIPLAREVRADRDGIRTFLAAGEARIKFEIVLEGRIDLDGGVDERLELPVLHLDSVVAEKLLANADRGLDESTRSRDLIDLAFLGARHGQLALVPGLRIAEGAYGSVVVRHLELVLSKLQTDKKYAASCIESLGIEDAKTLRKGLARLRTLASSRRQGRSS